MGKIGIGYDDKFVPEIQQKMVLGKTVYNNKELTDSLDRDFSSLLSSQPNVNVERFFDIYRELFYKIQRSGEPNDTSATKDPASKSHWELIRESQDYLNNYIDWRDKVIDNLFDQINELNEILLNKLNRENNQHPMYPDGTFLRSPARNANGLPIWIMQNGVKREIQNYNTYKALKRASLNEYDDSDDDICQLLEISTLDGILDGPPIIVDKDLNLMNWQATDLDITLQGITDYIESELTCLEGSDVSDLAPVFSSAEMFNTEAYQPRFDYCEIEYTSLDIVVPGDSKETTEKIFPGDTITIKYRANTNENILSLNVKQGFTQEKIIKNTQKELREPIRKDAFGNWVDELGNIIYKYHDLPGVPYSMKKLWVSSYGTTKVQPNERATDTSWWLPYKDHGWKDEAELEIQTKLWEEVFNDSTNVYYNDSVEWNGWQGPRGGLYGEPIYYITPPLGQEGGWSNLFAVKAGIDFANLEGGGYSNFILQYYVILNKDYAPFNQLDRIKAAVKYPLSSYVVEQAGGMEVISNMSSFEAAQIAESLSLPVEVFTNNWSIVMDNATRSNQKLAYPGFNFIY